MGKKYPKMLLSKSYACKQSAYNVAEPLASSFRSPFTRRCKGFMQKIPEPKLFVNPFIVQIIFILVYVQTLCKALRVTKMPLECGSKYVFVPGYGYFKPRKMGFTNSIEHPHECAGCHALRVDSPAARLLLLVCCTLGLKIFNFDLLICIPFKD